MTFFNIIVICFRTYSNVTKCQSDATLVDKSSLGTETCVSDDVNSSCNKENQTIKHNETINVENTRKEGLICSPKLKKRKLDETKVLEQTFLNMSNRIMNYMETSKPSTEQQMMYLQNS